MIYATKGQLQNLQMNSQLWIKFFSKLQRKINDNILEKNS